MKTSLFFLANLIFLSFFTNSVSATDVYAEYKMTGITNKAAIIKMYSKNGDLRTETSIDIGGRSMNTVMLMLKSKPKVTLILNTASKIYTETKTVAKSNAAAIDIKVIGTEKIGNYNCTRVKMSSQGKTWELWYTKDLPAISFPVNGDNDLGSQKMMALLKSKGISGMPVKINFLKPNSTTSMMTMLLAKFEQKALNASLFTIPAGYKKNETSFNPKAMKNMTPEQQKEMIKKMMKAQQPK